MLSYMLSEVFGIDSVVLIISLESGVEESNYSFKHRGICSFMSL